MRGLGFLVDSTWAVSTAAPAFRGGPNFRQLPPPHPAHLLQAAALRLCVEAVVAVADSQQVLVLLVPGHARHLGACGEGALPVPQVLDAWNAIGPQVRKILERGRRERGEGNV